MPAGRAENPPTAEIAGRPGPFGWSGAGAPPPTLTRRLGAGLLVLLAALAALEAHGDGTPVALILAGIGAFALLCVARLEVAFAGILALAPFSREIFFRGAGGALQIPTEPMLFVALAAWGLRFLARGGTTLRQPGFAGALCLSLLACILSIVGSQFRIVAIKATLNASWYALFGVFILNNFRDRRRLAGLATALLVPATALSLFSLGSVVTGHFDPLEGYWWGGPFFGEHGTFAAYLSFACLLALALALELRGMPRLVLAAVALLTGSQVILSLTRGAWMGLGAAAIALPFLGGRRLLRRGNLVLAAAGAVLVAALILFSGTGARLERHGATITSAGYESNLERVNRWFAGWRMFQSHPVTGVGYGAYTANYLNYRRAPLGTEQAGRRMGVHSEYLRVLCETGLVGLATAAIAFLALVRIGWRAVRRARDPLLRGLALGAAGGLITYLVHGAVNNFLAYDKVAAPFWAAVGMLGALVELDDPPAGSRVS